MQRVACRALGFRGFECSVFSVQYSGFGIRRVPRQFVVQRCLSMCATGRRTSPNFTEPRTGVPRSDRAHPPLVRQQHSCPADRARSAAFGFTIHDSHSLPPRLGKRNTESGKRRSHSRFTIHIHIPPRASAGGRQVAFGVTIHDSHSHPPASVGRWSASLLSPILPLEELFHVGIHPCLFAASEAFVNLESALWPCPMVLRQAFDGTVWCATSSALSPRADFETSQRVAEADAAMRRRLGEAHGESLDRVGPCGFDPFG